MLRLTITLIVGLIFVQLLSPPNVGAQAVSDFVWIANFGGDSVSKIQKSSNTVVATIGAVPLPLGVAVDDSSVWVANLCPGSGVRRISKSTDSVTATVSLGTCTWGVAVDQNFAWATSPATGNVFKISKSSNTVAAVIPTGSIPWGIAVDENSAWVAADGAVVKIDKSTNSVTSIPIAAPTPRGIAVDQDSVWVAGFTVDTVFRISKASNTITTISTDPGIRPIAIAVDSVNAWVVTQIAGTLLKIDKSSNTISTTIVVTGGLLHGVAVDSDSVWTDGFFDNETFRIDKAAGLISAMIPVGTNPATHGDFTGFAYDSFFATPTSITVAIDIKPGSLPNSINLKSKGNVPVALLGSASFDVDDVAVSTVKFAGALPVRFSFEDVNLDGHVDLVFHFRTQDLQLTLSSTQATLTGKTLGGTLFTGTDSVRIVK